MNEFQRMQQIAGIITESELKEKSNTNDATKGSQLNEINLNQDQEKLLKDLYSVIKNYYSTLSNPQVVGTIDQLKDLYI
jgi:hypothetical protein